MFSGYGIITTRSIFTSNVNNVNGVFQTTGTVGIAGSGVLNMAGGSVSVAGGNVAIAGGSINTNTNNSYTANTNSNTALSLVDSMYTELSNYMTTVNTLLHEFMNGDFYTVANVLTPQFYNQIAVHLNNLALDPTQYRVYENLRQTCTSALSGLYQAILQYQVLLDTQSQLELCSQKEEILNDPAKLNAYIQQLKKNFVFFHEANVTVIKATIKPEYQEYINMYGFPPGAVFEMDKMAIVLKKLHMA